MKKRRYKNTRGFVVFENGVLKTKSRRLKRLLKNSPFNSTKLLEGYTSPFVKVEIFIPKNNNNVD